MGTLCPPQISATLVKGKARIKFDAPKVRRPPRDHPGWREGLWKEVEGRMCRMVRYAVPPGHLQPGEGPAVLQVPRAHPREERWVSERIFWL